MGAVVLRATNVRKEFFRKSRESARNFDAVQTCSLALHEGEIVACIGRSGSGKTTLLNMLGGLLEPTEGTVEFLGQDLYALPDSELSQLRNRAIGVVPQGQAPIHSLTVLQNAMLPALLYGQDAGLEKRAADMLAQLSIGALAESYPAELSGGELRRMALARALVMQPKLVLADEPTGDLDKESTNLVLEVLAQAANQGAAVFLVTHDAQVEEKAHRVVEMDAGVLTERTGQERG